jgi:hypothetical protein
MPIEVSIYSAKYETFFDVEFESDPQDIDISRALAAFEQQKIAKIHHKDSILRLEISDSDNPVIQFAEVLPLIVLWLLLVKVAHSFWRKIALRKRAALNHESAKFVFFQPNESPGNDVKTQPRGMGGWLKFFAVTFTFISPITLLVHSLTTGVIIGDARDFPEIAEATALKRMLYANLILAVIFSILTARTGWKVLQVKPDALLWLRRYWWAFWTWQGGFVLLFYAVNPFPSRWMLLPGTVIGSVLHYGLWRIYMQSSRRVQNTFGHWNQAAYRTTTFLSELKERFAPAGNATALMNDEAKVEATEDRPGEGGEAPNSTLPNQSHRKTQESHPEAAAGSGAKTAPFASDLRLAEAQDAVNAAFSKEEPPLPSIDKLTAFCQVAEEAKTGYFHEGLWLLCLTECEGDTTRATHQYNLKRAEMIQRQVDAQSEVTPPS